jgi:sulfite reductase (ferredoxin)
MTELAAGEPPVETAAQRVERIKRERPSWSILDDIKDYAPHGFGAIPPDDLAVRFRAWGLYTQGDGFGTRGGEEPFFMMRLRTPNGLLTSRMVQAIADISDRYARSTIDITNRQNFQLHWLKIEDVPRIWSELEEVGWTSMGACGDNTRTVTGCPLAGVDAHEIFDASPIALAVDRAFNGNPEFANLPRKFKISITGCASWCSYPEINDIGATATRRADGSVGFHVRVGGGLSTRPHFAKLLPAIVRPEQVLDVVLAIAGIFRDSDELRLNRAKARMKFLFLTQGWTADRLLGEVERRIGYALDAAEPEIIPDAHARDHVGVHPQLQPGLSYAAFSVVSGRVTPAQLRGIAMLAERYGSGRLRNTVAQNIAMLDVPTARIADLVADARVIGVPLDGSPFQRGTASCTGSEFCKLALTETKQFSIHLSRALETRMPGFTDEIKLHVAGCPNSCGQHWIADVGLQGVRVTTDNVESDGFDIFVGGGVGRHSAFARRVGVRVSADGVPAVLERLFGAYIATRTADDSFLTWSARYDAKTLKAILGDDAEQASA